MKKRIFLALMLMTLFVSVGAAASANAQSSTMVFEIPFDFYAGKKLIPAGTYDVNPLSNNNSAVLIRRRQGGNEACVVLTYSVQAKTEKAGPARLVFNKYDDQHFLATLWDRSTDGRAIPTSKRERNLRQELQVSRSRSNAQRSGTVMIAARLEKN